MIPETTPRNTQQQKHALAEPDATKTLQSQIHDVVHAGKPPVRWSARRRRDAWFLLLILLLGIVTIFALSNGAATVKQRANIAQLGTPPATTTSGTPTPPARVLVRTAQKRLYPFPSSNVGLMQPAVDAQGNVWVGEMYANRLARLDSRTGVVTTWAPPNGKYGIMTAAVDTRGNVWFVEQGANYIGRFDPVRQTFRTFPLGTSNGHPLGPQALQFDASGNLWFTGVSAGRIGRLDPTTGVIQTWVVPPPAPKLSALPFSLAVTHDGQVWFGDLTGGAVGHLDPATDRVTLYRLADPQAQVFSMASDARGRIWFTEIVPGKLGLIDSATGRVTELLVPAVAGHPAALYGLVVAHDGAVWFVNNGADALVRYSPKDTSYTFFELSLPSSAPFGLTLDSAGRLWFTASGSSANTVGEMHP
jgi:virginiamycin B lyase